MEAVGGFLLILIGIGAIVIIIAPQLIGTIEILINREGLSDQVENWELRTKAVVFSGGLLLFFLGLGAILQVSVETLSTWFVTPTANPIVKIPVENSPKVDDQSNQPIKTQIPASAISPTSTELLISSVTPAVTSTEDFLSPTPSTTPTATITPKPVSSPTEPVPETDTATPFATPTSVRPPRPTATLTRTPTAVNTLPPSPPTPMPSPTSQFGNNSNTTEAEPTFQGKLAFSFIDRDSQNLKVYVVRFPEKNGIIRLTGAISLPNARQPTYRYDNQTLSFKGAGSKDGLFYKKNDNPSCRISKFKEAQWPVWSLDGDKVAFAIVDKFDSNKSELHMLFSTFGKFLQDDQCPPALPFVTKLELGGKPLTGEHVLWLDNNNIIFRGCATWVDDYGTCGTFKFDMNFSQPPKQIIEGDHRYPMDAKRGLIALMSDEIYGQDEPKDWDIYLYITDKGPFNITNNSTQDGLPAISPDGRYIAYISNEESEPEQWRLWLVDLKTLKREPWAAIEFHQNERIDVQSWTADRMSWSK